MNDFIQERRENGRFQCNLEVRLRERKAGNPFRMVHIDNISVGGMLCRDNRLLEVESNLDIEINLSSNVNHLNPIKVEGWVRHISQNDQGDYLIGVQFIIVQNVSPEELAERLEEVFF